MQASADVKIRGVIVGEVRSISSRPDGATLTLALDPQQAELVPASVSARLLPKTLFGERFVDLVPPAGDPGRPIREGDVIPQDRTSVAIELERVFDELLPLLRTVKPEKLAATLNALATALDGRGTRLGENLVLVDRYFTRLNPQLPLIEADISGLADLASTYADAAPNLLRAADALRTTNATIVEKKDQLAGFLAGTAGFANTTAEFLEKNDDRIIQVGRVQRPTLAVLAKHAPVYPCLAQGLVGWIPRAEGIFAGGQFHITLETPPQRSGYRPGQEPAWNDDRGPSCRGLPDPGGSQQHPARRGDVRRRQRWGRPLGPALGAARAHRRRRRQRRLRPRRHHGRAGGRRDRARPRGTGRAVGPHDPARRPDAPGEGGQPVRTAPSLVKLLAFVVVTVLATGILAATIANVLPGDKASYRAVFTDVTGLSAGQDVRIAGVRVGTVEDIRVARDRVDAEVTFSVLRSTTLTRGTAATIKYRNLVGERYVALTQEPGDAAPLPENGTIPLGRTHPALDLTVLFNGFKPLFAALSPSDVNELSAQVISVLQGEGGDINSLLGQTASLTGALADRDAVIGRTIDNLTTVLTTVEADDTAFKDLLTQLQRFVSGLAEDRKAIGDSLTNINRLTGDTATLLAAGRPDLKADVANLGDLATTLNKPENTKEFERFIGQAPTKIATITRTATYGSWFNFYLCRFDVENLLLPTGKTPGNLGYDVAAARCRG